MKFRTHAITALTTAALGLGFGPTIARADTPAPTDTVTVLAPTAGAAVGGSHQAIILKGPAGTVPHNVTCSYMNNFPTVTWSPQAADGTIHGVADLSQCLSGKSSLDIEYTTPTTDSVIGVDVNFVNPGRVFSFATTSDSFTPNGDHIGDTVAVHGDGDLNIERNGLITVHDAQGKKIRTLKPRFWMHDGEFPFGTVQFDTMEGYVATWDGRTDSGKIAAPGKYTIKISTSSAGHHGASLSSTVTLKRSAKVSNATQIDLSKGGSAVTFDHPVTTEAVGTDFDENVIMEPNSDFTWYVLDSKGNRVYDIKWPMDHMLHPYSETLTWHTTQADGTKVPAGHYTLVVTTISDGTITKLPLVVRAS